MNTKKRINYIFALAVFLSACAATETPTNDVTATLYDKINKASFFIGEWENREKDGVMIERWQKLNDSVFVGESCFVSGNDTMSSEKIIIEQRGKELYFIPRVKGQNNNQPIEFKLTESSPTHVVFENPQHDFPTKITYTLLTKDSLIAEVSGMIDNKSTSHQFPLKKFK